MTPPGPADDSLRVPLRISLSGCHPNCHNLCQVWQHPDKVLALAVSPDGQTVVTGCADGKVRLWDLKLGRCRHQLDAHNGAVCAVGFGCQDNTFISGGAD